MVQTRKKAYNSNQIAGGSADHPPHQEDLHETPDKSACSGQDEHARPQDHNDSDTGSQAEEPTTSNDGEVAPNADTLDEPSDDTLEELPPPINRDTSPQSHAGRSLGAENWKPWEDRALADEVQVSEVWKSSRRDGGAKRIWEGIARRIASKNPSFSRTGTACKAHFLKLLAREKKSETAALQTTGEGSDIDGHVEIMADLLGRFSDQAVEQEKKTENAKVKINIEKAAGEEIRNAAMEGLVHHKKLTDITQIEGSTAREKGAQRKERKRSLESDQGEDLADGENKPPKKARKTARMRLLAAVESRNESDKAALEQAKRTEQAHHTETRDAIHAMADAITDLASSIREDRRQRIEESTAQRVETSTLLSVVESLAKK